MDDSKGDCFIEVVALDVVAMVATGICIPPAAWLVPLADEVGLFVFTGGIVVCCS